MYLAVLMLALQSPDETVAERRRVVEEVQKQLEVNYFRKDLGELAWGEVDYRPELSTEDFYASVNRVLAALKDEHTGVDTPRAVAMRKTGTRFGLGVTARMVEDRFAVMGVQEGSPAAAQGIERGWTIRAIQGKEAPKSAAGFVPWMREVNVPRLCEAGPVELRAADRKNIEKVLQIGCAEVSDRDVREAKREGEVLRLKFGRFDRESAEWFVKSLEENREAKKLVLDLRGNVGGERTALLRIAGALVGKESVGRSTARRGRVTEWRGTGKVLFQGPMVVLTDELTASAGEILAGALQERGQAKVMGRTTMGSVLVMIRRGLPGGGQLRLSVEDFVLPSGKRLEGVGVKPDQLMELTVAELQAGRDAVLEAAVAALR